MEINVSALHLVLADLCFPLLEHPECTSSLCFETWKSHANMKKIINSTPIEQIHSIAIFYFSIIYFKHFKSSVQRSLVDAEKANEN